MSKKKIAALLVAGALTVGVVGGTLAWFTSKDTVTNKFTTAGLLNPDEDPTDPDKGIKIVEDFKKEEAKNLTPGANVNKDVQVKNTSTYDQFIRVRLTPKFVKVVGENGEEEYEEVETNFEKELDIEKIELAFTNHLIKTIPDEGYEGSWYYNEDDDYYYYLGKVSPGSHTNTLLDDVTFCKTAGNEYKNLGFDIIVEAEGIQAANDAYADGWAPESLSQIYETLQDKEEATKPDDYLEPNADDHPHKGKEGCNHTTGNLVK